MNTGILLTRCERVDQLEQAHRRFIESGAATRGPRYPLAALYEIIGSPSASEVARAAGLHLRQVTRALAEGCVTELLADRLAMAYDLHPCLVWPEWFE